MGGCNVDADCPGETCNTTTHTCQAIPDAGTPGDGGTGADATSPADAGPVSEGGSADAGVMPGIDASPEGADAAASSGSYLDGGGLSCSTSSTGAGGGPVVPGALAALGLLGLARRRRSR
jgi:MYXO-CTERM domain-containing protein